MVSTRQMSTTTIGPESGSSNVGVSNVASRSNSVAASSQQQHPPQQQVQEQQQQHTQCSQTGTNQQTNMTQTSVPALLSLVSSLATNPQQDSHQQSVANQQQTSQQLQQQSQPQQNNQAGCSSTLQMASNKQSSNNGNNSTVATKDGSQKQTRQLSLQDMPFEILDKIFSYVGYKEVSNMRLVSKQMNQTCITILNSTFSKLQTQLMKRFQDIKKVMPRRESARRSHPLSYECDIVETCYMRLSLLQMSFGRYIEHKHCCFFPGAILDEVYNVINYIRTTPKLGRPYKITEELIDLSTMAMEYFKDHLEPSLPQFGLFSKDFLESGSSTTSSRSCYLLESNSSSTSSRSGNSSSMPSPPQSNMVLRKGIRKIKQGMKKYNNQLTVLRNDLRFCKKKSTEQTKQITELQNMLAETQKQTLEYANRLDENDKKSEEMSRKISTLLQELNKCKIELHYWRSKSPATPICNNCGQTTLNLPSAAEDILALMNQSISTEDIINLTGSSGDLETEVQSHESSLMNLAVKSTQLIQKSATRPVITPSIMMDVTKSPSSPSSDITSSSPSFLIQSSPTVTTVSDLMSNSLNEHNNCNGSITAMTAQLEQKQQGNTNQQPSVILNAAGLSKIHGKRKWDGNCTVTESSTLRGQMGNGANRSMHINDNNVTNNDDVAGTGAECNTSHSLSSLMSETKTATNIANTTNNTNISDNCNKKARRVQIKSKSQTNNVKTRNK